MSSKMRFGLVAGVVALWLGAGMGCGPNPTTSGSQDAAFEDDVSVLDASDAQTCQDFDQDGYGEGCDLGEDCNDLDRDIHPGAEERCGNDADDDCDGVTDEDCSCETGDVRLCSSFGDPETLGPPMICRPGLQHCEDGVWSDVCEGEVGPAPEMCNGVDDDCDGDVDEGLLNPQGECSSTVPEESCGPTGEGNGIDDDGDGEVDEGCSCAVPDYDPNLPRQNQPCYSGPPLTLGVGICHGGTRDCLANGTWGACQGEQLPETEVCGDSLDNDCDGYVDEGCPVCTNPQDEVCDGIDNDCDGLIDEGVRNGCGGCGPVADAEVCGDGLDNDCNGSIDDGCSGCTESCYPGPPETDGVGACRRGVRTCNGEFPGPCEGYVLPTLELCGDDGRGNGIDDDCDGLTDENCICVEGQVRFCGDGAGQCEYGTQVCHGNAWGDCEGGTGPAPEVCDGLDNDCDGLADEDLLNACGTCGESCYSFPVDAGNQGQGDNGIQVIPGNDPDNPTGRDGITLTETSFSPPYLWAANHDYDTVTKFNTDTKAEEGRYWVGHNPSRTAVDLDGNMWVGGRNDGRLTKVLWDVNSCDPNHNGQAGLQTSSGTNVVNSASNPYGDDCVVYSEIPNPSFRSIRGVAAGPDGRIWIGYTNGGVQWIDPHTFQLGPYYDDAQIPRWDPDGNGVLQPTNGQVLDAGGVYGLVVDSNGLLYTSSYSRNTLAVFDTTAGQEGWLAVYTGLCGSYGIAVDGQNRIWLGGWPNTGGIAMFDPTEMRFYHFRVGGANSDPSPGETRPVVVTGAFDCGGYDRFRTTGVAIEPATGDPWTSFYPIGYTGRLVLNPNDYTQSHWIMIGTTRDSNNNFLSGVSADLRGVGFDHNGYAWTLGLGSGNVWKIDPATNARAADLPTGQTIGEGSHYTYSDFTGSTALNFTAPRGFWRYIFDTQFDEAQVDEIQWDAYVPSGTTAGIRIRALDSNHQPVSGWLPPEQNGNAQYFDYPAGNPATASVDLHANGGPLVGYAFEVDVRLTTTDRNVRPIVTDVRLVWQRP